MRDYQRSARVDATPGALFDFLADVSNLPMYFDRMTDAEPVGPDVVQVTAQVHGRQLEGLAQFHVDRAAKRVTWSSKGHNSYYGELTVTGQGNTSEVLVKVHTNRAEAEAAQIYRSIEKTLDNIARLVEQGSSRAA